MRSLRKTTKSFIRDANLKHSNFYDYSLVDYKGCCKKVKIICPIHGEFEQNPSEHLYGKGCIKCGFDKTRLSILSNTEEFVEKAKKIHDSFYTYANCNYINALDLVSITCPVHGDYLQRPNVHLNGRGCKECYKDRNGFGRSSFIKSCKNNVATLYLISCSNDNESFYKIGITGKNVVSRFRSFSHFPYSYNILYLVENTPEYIFDLEKTLHRKYKDLSYKPLLDFKGSTECFLLTTDIIKNDF